jgi:hemerythrin superfamily protein
MIETLSRRSLAIGAVGLTAAAAMSRAVAQTAAAGGTWFDMVKAHHAMIAHTFDEIDASEGDPERTMMLFKRQSYLLTAHSVAEENVLYPAIARMGMKADSDHLYLDQAHAKVLNSDIEVMMKDHKRWRDDQATLKGAVLHHAKDDEEANLFPRLMAAWTAEQNAMMTAGYAREFARVGRA